MATEYKIIYTYTGQGNTSGNRSVALNRFKKTGDTGRTIGQIKSITYEHWHTSTYKYNWALRGRLVLSDDTNFVSDTVTHQISGDTVKFVNTFTGDSLPTAEQFAKLSTVQTLDSQGKTTSGGYGSAVLYWRANSNYPMRVIVTFVEEPPVVYAPEITTFDVTRCNASYEPDDEGTYAVTNMKIALGDAAGASVAQLRVYYAANAYPVVGESEYIDLTSRIPELLTGVVNDTTILPGEWSAGATWYYAAVFIAGDENAVDTFIMPRALSNLHISGKPNGGVCVCGYSQGTEEKPMFESYAPGYFYEGIHGVTNYTLGEVKTGGKWIDGKSIYRSVLQFTTTLNGAGDVVANLPNMPETLISARGFFSVNGSTSIRPIPFCQFNDIQYSVNLNVSSDNTAVSMTFGTKWSGTKEVYLILEYTRVNEEAST